MKLKTAKTKKKLYKTTKIILKIKQRKKFKKKKKLLSMTAAVRNFVFEIIKSEEILITSTRIVF